MKKWKTKITVIFALLAASLCLTAVCLAEDYARPPPTPCVPYRPHNFKSTAIFTVEGKTYELSSAFRRSLEDKGGGMVLAASGSVSRSLAGKNMLYGSDSAVELRGTCLAPGPYTFDDMLKFGMPGAWPAEPHEKGDFWMADIILAYGDITANVTISYSLDDVTSISGVRVAKLGIMLNGSDSDGAEKARWGGFGYEIWNIDEGIPLVRVIEVKRGASFQDKVEMRFEYAESFID